MCLLSPGIKKMLKHTEDTHEFPTRYRVFKERLHRVVYRQLLPGVISWEYYNEPLRSGDDAQVKVIETSRSWERQPYWRASFQRSPTVFLALSDVRFPYVGIDRPRRDGWDIYPHSPACTAKNVDILSGRLMVAQLQISRPVSVDIS